MHDLLVTAATALPVLYVPVVLLLLDRRGADGRPQVHPFMMLLYALIFVNAELPALAGIGRYSHDDKHAIGGQGIQLLLAVGVAMIFGLVLAFGPVADRLIKTPPKGTPRPFWHYFGFFTLVEIGVVLPVTYGRSLLPIEGVTAWGVFWFLTVAFFVMSLIGAALGRVVHLAQLARRPCEGCPAASAAAGVASAAP